MFLLKFGTWGGKILNLKIEKLEAGLFDLYHDFNHLKRS